MTRRIRFVALLAACVVVPVCGSRAWSAKVVSVKRMSLYVPPKSPEEIELNRLEQAEGNRIRSGGKFFKPLRMLVDYPGVMDATLIDGAASELPATTPIIGIEIEGEHCAFVVDAMLAPETHIVNIVLNHRPVSVTYCDMVDCVRVLTDDRNTQIPLRVGGLDIDNQMVFLLDGVRYGQSSKDIPLADHRFDRMELGAWQQLHPKTKIYAGPMADQSDS